MVIAAAVSFCSLNLGRNVWQMYSQQIFVGQLLSQEQKCVIWLRYIRFVFGFSIFSTCVCISYLPNCILLLSIWEEQKRVKSVNSRWVCPLGLRFAKIPPPPIGFACKFTCDQACNYIYTQSRPLCGVFTRCCIIYLGACCTNIDRSGNGDDMVMFCISYFVNQYFWQISICILCVLHYLPGIWVALAAPQIRAAPTINPCHFILYLCTIVYYTILYPSMCLLLTLLTSCIWVILYPCIFLVMYLFICVSHLCWHQIILALRHLCNLLFQYSTIACNTGATADPQLYDGRKLQFGSWEYPVSQHNKSQGIAILLVSFSDTNILCHNITRIARPGFIVRQKNILPQCYNKPEASWKGGCQHHHHYNQ